MKIGKILLAIAALGLTTANAALAGPKFITSAPASASYPNFSFSNLRCNIVNVDPLLSQDVTIETIDYNGNVCQTSSPITLGIFQATSFLDSTACAAWCRFTVNTSTKKFRAVATYENATGYTAANVAN